MTESQYQSIRAFVEQNKNKLDEDQLSKLKDVLRQARDIRNRIFSWKQKVIDSTRLHERYDT